MDIEEIEVCTYLSDQDNITFPEVVSRLKIAGIESYYADLLAPNKTYYSGNSAITVKCNSHHKKVAEEFNPEGLIETIKLVQRGAIKYQEFVKKIMECGVLSYLIFINGKKALYFGRKGEIHTESFVK